MRGPRLERSTWHYRCLREHNLDDWLQAESELKGRVGKDPTGVVLTVHHPIEHLRAAFLEMPGLRLTAAQVERLCGVEQTICKTVLDALVDAQLLRVSVDSIYVRVTDGASARQRPVKTAHARLPRERCPPAAS